MKKKLVAGTIFSDEPYKKFKNLPIFEIGMYATVVINMQLLLYVNLL